MAKKTGKKPQSAKKFKGKQISTTATVNQITVAAKKDKISFTAMSLSGKENELMTDLIKQESDVFVDITIDGMAEFKMIQVRGKLKAYKISKTCDSPEIINLKFSASQVEQLTHLIRSAEQITLTFLECEPELDFEE